ncbi:MAG: ferrochelatase [Coriobacteriales bacterium]|nr:ferrochelatase [Coriobacteriales bacterium]
MQTSTNNDIHDKVCWGVLLVNTGTPQEPTLQAIRPYLDRFLSDRRIVNLPPWLWKPILRGLVLPLRSRKLVDVYRSIWTEEGSPYTLAMRTIESQLRVTCERKSRADLHIAVAHRYGLPSIAQCLTDFQRRGITALCVLPLYPQQAFATTFSVNDEVQRALAVLDFCPSTVLIEDYYQDKGYIQALSTQIATALQPETVPGAQTRRVVHNSYSSLQPKTTSDTQPDTQALPATGASAPIVPGRHVLFSYHSIPLKDLRNGDRYRAQVETTTRLLVERLGLPSERWSLVYQSRFENGQRWLGPFLLPRLKALLSDGWRDFAVVTPGFAVDCAETLHSIQHSIRADLLSAANRHGIAADQIRFRYLPALGATELHISLLWDLITRFTGEAGQADGRSTPDGTAITTASG